MPLPLMRSPARLLQIALLPGIRINAFIPWCRQESSTAPAKGWSHWARQPSEYKGLPCSLTLTRGPLIITLGDTGWRNVKRALRRVYPVHGTSVANPRIGNNARQSQSNRVN